MAFAHLSTGGFAGSGALATKDMSISGKNALELSWFKYKIYVFVRFLKNMLWLVLTF